MARPSSRRSARPARRPAKEKPAVARREGTTERYLARHLQTLVGALGRLTRQPFATLMTVAVIGIALALPAGLHVLVTNARDLGGRWDSAVELSAYLSQEVTEAEARRLQRDLEGRDGIADVQLISSGEAMAEFQEYSGFGAALDALVNNPLPHLLVIRPADGADSAAALDALAAELDGMGAVDLAQVDTQWIGRFHAMLDVLRRLVGLAAGLLAIGVIIIVGNTIRLDIQNRRDEIEVTKLIGGTDAFIRRPFLYTGAWYGLAGGVMAVLLLETALLVLADPVRQTAGLYGSDFRLAGLDARAVLGLLGGGAALGWLGSWISATRNMRRIEPGQR